MSRDLHLTGPGCLPRATKWKRCAGKIFHHPGKFLGAGNPKVAHVSAEEVGELGSANNDAVVEVLGAQERPPPIVATNPVASFKEAFAKYPEILDDVYRKLFKKPSPIHSQAWPILILDHDLISVAQTNRGKTTGYLSPAALDLADSHVLQIPTCLVLAPTSAPAVLPRHVN